jgi:hypothetical protein
MQAGYGDKCVDVIIARYLVRRLKKKTWGKQVCLSKQDRVGQGGIEKIVKCWQKFIEVGGCCVEM